MPTIGADVDAQTKEQFRARAAAIPLSESRLACTLIMKFLQGDENGAPVSTPLILPPPGQPAAQLGPKTEPVYVRMPLVEYEALGRLASERHWHRGTYLFHLFVAHHHRRPVLCEQEINALRQVARQLADLGRNVNQIARKLNSSLDEAHIATGYEFDVLKMLLDLEATTVKDLLRANLRGWGVNDDQA